MIGKALLDKELRDRLFADPEAIARDFALPSSEAQAIRLLDRPKFEQMVARLRSG
ncbi:MAG TPA: Os1348 family NHLP clan protein [Bradyrhizobium sp.]|nr:Os1348 family NHLP clan protein [Bradyrhizobium sp.]